MILTFWMLNFKPDFSLSSYTFIKRLSSSSSLSAIRDISSAYLRLLIILPTILILICDSSIPAFHMLYSAYKLNRQCDNKQVRCTHFPVLNQCFVPCLILTCFLICIWVSQINFNRFPRRLLRLTWYSHLFKNFPVFVIHIVKGFSVFNEAEVYEFFGIPLLLLWSKRC